MNNRDCSLINILKDPSLFKTSSKMHLSTNIQMKTKTQLNLLNGLKTIRKNNKVETILFHRVTKRDTEEQPKKFPENTCAGAANLMGLKEA
jgi:hypothetical protein